MRINHTLLFLQLLGLLLCLLAVLSFIGSEEEEAAPPARIAGKWRLLHVEDPYKVVIPPTDVVRVEIAFVPGETTNVHSPGASTLRGNILSGDFSGSVSFNADGSKGALQVRKLNLSEQLLPDGYKQFDDYYLQQLARATSFQVRKDQLIISSQGKAKLVYTRAGDS